MSHETSQYWSNFESVRENIEYEFRMKFYSKIEEEIRGAVMAGFPPAYVNGMEYIKTLLLETQDVKESIDIQPKLF